MSREKSSEVIEQDGGVSNFIGAFGRELSLKCLLRLSRSDYGFVASLSRDMRSLVRSGDIYRLRLQQGVVEHWVYLGCYAKEWHAYDPYRGRWMQLPSMPADECFTASDKESLAVGTELLVFGMSHTVFGMAHTVLRYSILTNSWTQDGPMNSPRCLFGSTSVGKKAYVAGGIAPTGEKLSSAEMYDSEAHTWTPLPSMTRARMMCSVVFMDGKLYAIGGSGINGEALTCGEEYDFKGRSWRVIDNMYEHQPEVRCPPTAVVNNKLYVADFSTKNVRKYDKQNNKWITLGKLPQRSRVINPSYESWSLHFRACGDRLLLIGDPSPRTCNDRMVELNSWVPDEQPLVWNLMARRPGYGDFVYNAAVMSC
uniref:Uncharacterized protein n=1 Tax=Avena sativa TaxID=4498 RepID=A0ACD5V8W7_AVESA